LIQNPYFLKIQASKLKSNTGNVIYARKEIYIFTD
jgi:hypothetical protein